MPETQQPTNPHVTQVHRSVVYSAPLPEARQFAHYEEVVTGAADRILKMAENQSRHRQFIEKWSVVGDQVRSMVGLLAGLIVAITGLASTVYLVMNDNQIAGTVLGIGTLSSIVASLVYGSQQKSKEIKKRRAEMDET